MPVASFRRYDFEATAIGDSGLARYCPVSAPAIRDAYAESPGRIGGRVAHDVPSRSASSLELNRRSFDAIGRAVGDRDEPDGHEVLPQLQ